MSINVYEVMCKLIGPIMPVGETNYDDRAFENLKTFVNIFEQLMSDLAIIEEQCKNAHQYSIKRSGELAAEALARNGIGK